MRSARSEAVQQQLLDVHGVMGTEEAKTATGFINGVRVSCLIMMPHHHPHAQRRRSEISQVSQMVEQQQNWRRREYAIGIYHPSFREG